MVSLSFFLYLCFLNLFGSGHDWKSRFPSWKIPQLWTFLGSCTGCWATLTRPWFFQERLDHRIIEIPPNLVFYDCMESVTNTKVVLNPIFYWHNSMSPLAILLQKQESFMVFCLPTVFFNSFSVLTFQNPVPSVCPDRTSHMGPHVWLFCW